MIFIVFNNVVHSHNLEDDGDDAVVEHDVHDVVHILAHIHKLPVVEQV
jgi:hypothetical protein